MKRKAERRKKNKGNYSLLVILGICVVLLMVILGGTTYSLLASSLRQGIIIDDATSKYLSFSYAQDEKQLYKIDKPRKLSDEKGSREKSFNFSIEANKKDFNKEKLEYMIILSPVSEGLANDNIKVYLTDENNKAVTEIARYSELEDTTEGKILYTGTFTKNNLLANYKLRIWIDTKYKGKYDGILAYRIQVKNK